MTRYIQLSVIAVLAFILSATACRQQGTARPEFSSHGGLQASSKGSKEFLGVSAILVLPVVFDKEAREQDSWRSRVEMELFSSAQIASGLNVTSWASLNSKISAPTLAQGCQAALRSGVDAVMTTRILQLQDRVGSAVGVTKPAHVFFEMSLHAAATQAQIWQSSYHFEDEALSENLLQLKDRVPGSSDRGWKQAQTLLRRGFTAAFEDISARRASAFVLH